MTFKHTNFEDSATMRSLVKVAKDKGWVKEEPIQKTASAPKLDLTPSTSLMENVAKLCAGLRASGFEKQAEEVESKFIQLKRANTLYNVGNETGEDLVHAAHPKGSHKMEDVDSKEATFEDILDKHIQHLEVANSKPTGKYSSSQDLLKAVKRVLANAKVVTAAPTLDELYEQASTALRKFEQIFSNISLQVGEDASTNRAYFNAIQYDLDKKQVYQNSDLENALTDAIDNFKNDKEPGWFSSGGESQKWQDVILPMISIANRFALQFQAAVKDIRKMETASKTEEVTKQYDPDAQPQGDAKTKEPTASPQVTRLKALVTKLNGYKLISSVSRNPAASKWLNDELKEVTQLLTNVQKPEAQAVMPALERDIAEKESEVNQFASKWVGQV